MAITRFQQGEPPKCFLVPSMAYPYQTDFTMKRVGTVFSNYQLGWFVHHGAVSTPYSWFLRFSLVLFHFCAFSIKFINIWFMWISPFTAEEVLDFCTNQIDWPKNASSFVHFCCVHIFLWPKKSVNKGLGVQAVPVSY